MILQNSMPRGLYARELRFGIVRASWLETSISAYIKTGCIIVNLNKERCCIKGKQLALS